MVAALIFGERIWASLKKVLKSMSSQRKRRDLQAVEHVDEVLEDFFVYRFFDRFRPALG